MRMRAMDTRNELSMMDLLRIAYQNKALIGLTTLLGLVLGCTIIYFSVPIYEAKIRLIAANEGDIAELNQGRLGNKSPLKPISLSDVHRVFIDTLLSESIKSEFFKNYYLPVFAPNLNSSRVVAQQYTSFSHLFAIVANPKHPEERFVKYTVAIRGKDAKQVAIWLNQFIHLVQSQTIATVLHDIQQQKQMLTASLTQQIEIARKTARVKRLDRITQLKEKMHMVQLASAQLPFWDDELVIMSDATNAASPANLEMIRAEISNLSKRASDDAFAPKLRDLQAQLHYYQSLKINMDNVVVFHLDGIIEPPVTPIAPQKKLILLESLVGGMLLGILLVMMQIAWRRQRTQAG